MASHSSRQKLPPNLLLEIAVPAEGAGHTDHALHVYLPGAREAALSPGP